MSIVPPPFGREIQVAAAVRPDRACLLALDVALEPGRVDGLDEEFLEGFDRQGRGRAFRMRSGPGETSVRHEAEQRDPAIPIYHSRPAHACRRSSASARRRLVGGLGKVDRRLARSYAPRGIFARPSGAAEENGGT